MSNKFILNSPRAKSVDKRTAVKLINNYAESYKKKEDENAFLLKKVEDLNNNLKLNKLIINTLTSKLPDDQKTKDLINNLNLEINELYSQNSVLSSQLLESNDKVNHYVIIADNIFRKISIRQH